MGNQAGLTVSEQPVGSDHGSFQQQKPPLRQRVAGASHFWASRFFPWSVDHNDVKVQDLRQSRFIPWVGIAALVCSALTVLLSWVVLNVISDKPQVEKSYLKPASWLSAILSSNSVLLHIALSEGVTTAWWFTAQRKNATLRDIHEAWAQGHSLSAVLLSGRRFNYVALATLFVASVPLNGLLLQNAITTYPSITVDDATVYVGMSSDLAAGWTADLYGEMVGPYSDMFGQAITIDGILSDTAYPNLAVYNGTENCGIDDPLGVCTANVAGVGFVSDCTTDRLAYDLDPRSHPDETFSAPIISSNLTWSLETPNSFNLTVVQKVDAACIGEYYVQRCTYKAAKKLYPLQIFPSTMLGAASGIQWGDHDQFLSLNPNTTAKDDIFVEYLPETSEFGKTNTTFGGLIKYLIGEFTSDLTWSYNGTMWSIAAQGDYATSAVLFDSVIEGDPDSMYYNRSLLSPHFCNNTYSEIWSSPDSKSMIEYLIEDKIRRLMFFSSIISWASSDSGDNSDASALSLATAQKMPSQRTAAILRYNILYRYWAASLAVTLTIMLMITPTFWGFWHLRGSSTLSPVDTAIAFNAPIVRTDIELQDPRDRLKEIGARPLNSRGTNIIGVP